MEAESFKLGFVPFGSSGPRSGIAGQVTTTRERGMIINMKKIIIISLMALALLLPGGCAKSDNITFTGTVESISEQSILVTTGDDVGFDRASVDLSGVTVDFDILVGSRLDITVLPEIRESEPVQATAVSLSQGDAPDYQTITPEEAKSMMEDGGVTVLDVRTLEEYNTGFILGSVSLPLEEIESTADTVIPDKNAVILVYCETGERSARAAQLLVSLGYVHVYDFGGIDSWPYPTASPFCCPLRSSTGTDVAG